MFSRRTFLVSGLAACLFANSSVGAPVGGFSLQDKSGESLDILRNGKLAARYMYAYDMSTKNRRDETYKPYLQVFDAQGEKAITKGPGGELPHHRGIFIGWNKLTVAGKSIDRWHMKGGEQIHRKFLGQQASPKGASFTSLVEWTGKDQTEVALKEERTFSLLPARAPFYSIIDTSSKLIAVGGETVLNGDPEHAGLQFRPASEIKRDETIFFFPGNPDLKKDRDLPWFGGSFTIHGKRYSVVYLNHPSNPKGAAVSAYRDYGRFGAFFNDTIPAGGEKTIRARFLIAEGEMPEADIIQKAWNEYAGTSEPTPEVTKRQAKAMKPAAPKAATSKPAAPKAPGR